MNRVRWLALAVGLAAGFLVAGPTAAADKNWKTAGGGGVWDTTTGLYWADGLAWNNAANDGAVFTAVGSGTVTVQVAEPIVVRSVDVGGTSGTYWFTPSGPGVLQFTDQGSSTAGPATVRVQNAAVYVHLFNVAGSRGLRKTGAGTIRIGISSTPGNSITGGLTIEGGTVEFSVDGNLGAAGEGVRFAGGGGTLAGLDGGFTVARPIVLDAPAVIRAPTVGTIGQPAGATPNTLSGTISGAGSLTLQGNIPFRLTGNNTFSGGITVGFGGRIEVASASELGTGTAPVTLTGSIYTPDVALKALGPFTSGRGLTVFDRAPVVDTNGFDVGLTGSLSTATPLVGFVKRGAGTLTVGGATNKLGQVNVEAGGLRLIGTTAVPNAGVVNLSAGTTLFVDADRRFQPVGAGAVQLANGVTLTHAEFGGTLGGSIGGGGNFAVEAIDPANGAGNFVTLTGVNSYTGTTRVYGGSLILQGGSDRLPLNTRLIVDANPVNPSWMSYLRIDDGIQTVRTLTGTGGRLFVAGSSTLRVGAGEAGSFTYAGQVGGGAVVKVGTGTWTLTGDNSVPAYGWGVGTVVTNLRVEEGRLNVTGVLAATLTGVTVGTGGPNTGTLGGTGAVGGPVTVNAGGTLTAGTAAAPGKLTLGHPSGSGAVRLRDGGTYEWKLATLNTANAGTDFDQLASASGAFPVLGGTSKVRLNFGLLPAHLRPDAPTLDPFWQAERRWVIGDWHSTNTEAFSGVENPTWAAGTFAVELGTGASAGDSVLVFTPTPVPEPGLLPTVAAVGVIALRRRAASRSTS